MEEAIKNYDIIPAPSKHKLEYSEQDLREIALKQDWKGDGTEESPYIVESTAGLTDLFCVKNSGLYLLIKECNFKHLRFISCQNISFENCSFLRLTLIKCQYFRIESNDIRNLELYRSKNNTFSNCNILRVVSKILNKQNAFNNCTIEAKKVDVQWSDRPDIVIFLKTCPIIIMAMAIFVFSSIYHSIYKESSLDFITIFSIVIFIIMVVVGILLWILYSLSKKK